MEPIKHIRSRTVVLPNDDIDTDQIIPARFLTTTTQEGLGKKLFDDWRYDARRQARARLRAEPAREPAAAQILVGRPQLRLRLVARARAVGAARLRHPRRRQHGDRGHLPQQLAEERPLPVVVDEDTHRWLLANPGADVTSTSRRATLALPTAPRAVPDRRRSRATAS